MQKRASPEWKKKEKIGRISLGRENMLNERKKDKIL